MFWISSVMARENSGVISCGVNPAMQQPISVTKNTSSLCFLANSIKSSTYGLMVSASPCMVGMAYDCPNNPMPWPHSAPNSR